MKDMNDAQGVKEIEQEINKIMEFIKPYSEELNKLRKNLSEKMMLDIENSEGKFFKQDINKIGFMDISEGRGIEYYYIKKYDKATGFCNIVTFNLDGSDFYCEEKIHFILTNPLNDSIEISKQEFLEAREKFLMDIKNFIEPQ